MRFFAASASDAFMRYVAPARACAVGEVVVFVATHLLSTETQAKGALLDWATATRHAAGADSLKEIAVTTSVTGSRLVGGLYTGCGCGVVRATSLLTSVKNSKGNPRSRPFPITLSLTSKAVVGGVDVVVVRGVPAVAMTEEPILLLKTRTMVAGRGVVVEVAVRSRSQLKGVVALSLSVAV